MKKIILSFVVLMLLSQTVFAFPFLKKTSNELLTLPVFSYKDFGADNRVWVGTFELVWNTLINDVIHGPIVFTDSKSLLVDELNKQNFNSQLISDKSYYTAHGLMTDELKYEIYATLQEKFNESSELLNDLNWDGKNYLVYAMLKKNFEFLSEFDKLSKDRFGKNKTKVDYFGIKTDSKSDLRDNVSVLFYNSARDFAVKLNTKDNDKVILYRTNDNKSFDVLYADLIKKSENYEGTNKFTSKDLLKVPNLKFKTKHEYTELEGRQIKGTDFIIDAAIQTIDFELNNKGVELKSEAGLIMKMSLEPVVISKSRNFSFNDTFVLFLIEEDRPYFALRVKDVAELNK